MTAGEAPKSPGEEIPLAGRRIVVTRARAQAADLTRRLVALGADVIEFPTIAIAPPLDLTPIDRAIARLEEYQWLFFTSVNGVKFFFDRVRCLGKDPEVIHKLKVVAIGPETAGRLERQGFRPHLVPEKYQAEGVLDRLNRQEICGSRVLMPRAAKAREILPDTLRSWGAAVDVVEAYQTVLPDTDRTRFGVLLQRRQIDMVTFTSSSTAAHFVRLLAGLDPVSLLMDVRIACIGPITAQTLADHGLRVDVTATQFTVPGLVDAIDKFYRSARGANTAG